VGVEPICAVLSEHGAPIAPSTYYQARAATRVPSARLVGDEALKDHIVRVHAANYGVYGPRKIWLALNREGIPVARCTIERLMRELGLSGALRSKKVRTTVADPERRGRRTWSGDASRCSPRTGFGLPISPTCPAGPARSTWRS
jgi:putative transposase